VRGPKTPTETATANIAKAKNENPCGSKTLEEESNDQARECSRQSSPGINEPNRATHTRRKQLRLISMRAIAHKAVHKNDQNAEHHQSEGSSVCREQHAEYGCTDGGANNLPLALKLFRNDA
jgi:hypothetical protein